MMNWLKPLFAWWDGQTIGTRIFTLRKGIKVGQDNAGNVFYQSADKCKRWVHYSGANDASKITPDWHGWLHYTWDDAPSNTPIEHQSWQQPHQANLSGTAVAYVPDGSLRAAVGNVSNQHYQAWHPLPLDHSQKEDT